MPAVLDYPISGILAVAWNGERLKQIRKAAGLDQTELGAAADCGQSSISLWERGDRIPGAEELYRLADALGVSCEAFRETPGGKIRWLPGRAPKPVADDD